MTAYSRIAPFRTAFWLFLRSNGHRLEQAPLPRPDCRLVFSALRAKSRTRKFHPAQMSSSSTITLVSNGLPMITVGGADVSLHGEDAGSTPVQLAEMDSCCSLVLYLMGPP